MSEPRYNVLFICTGNSARSILGESLMNQLGRGQFAGFSAGSQPKGQVHPFATELLTRLELPTVGLRSKSWEEFAAPGAPQMDFIFTVCDNAADETCPVWPGHPVTAHWGLPDPAAAQGTQAERRLAFADTLRMLSNRITAFINLPLSSLDALSLRSELKAIGVLTQAPDQAKPTT